MTSFIAYWEFDSYIYIEHLAVNPELRGNNIGSDTLNKLASLVDKVIILEIDPVKDDVSKKRLAFYEKLGYRVNPYQHFHPAYNKLYPPHELTVLSLNRNLETEEYHKFFKNLSEIVMKI